MNIKKRILKYIEYKGVSKYKFYQETGFSNGFLDKDGSIGTDKCEKISYQYPDISIEWLITGKGEMLRSTEPAAQQPEAVKKPTAPPPTGDSVIALYKEFLREKDEKIDTLNRRVWELEHENELIKELSAENARLKNRIEKLQSNVGEHYRIDDQMQPVPLVPQHINPPMREQNHPE